jgi:hypothetical protein
MFLPLVPAPGPGLVAINRSRVIQLVDSHQREAQMESDRGDLEIWLMIDSDHDGRGDPGVDSSL